MRTLSTPRETPATTPNPTPAAVNPLTADRTLARVLFDVWSGDPFTLVKSPPGAGKTRLITLLAHQLATRAGLRVVVAAQTRVQAYDVANRIHALDAPIALLSGNQATRPHLLNPGVPFIAGARGLHTSGGVLVATTQRWIWTSTESYRADVLLVDEAYQCTYANLAALTSMAAQVVLVGDPGQIAPVVRADTTRWNHHATGPHLSAPVCIERAYPDTLSTHHLTQTWRCGQATADLIAPFYPDLPFTSARPPIALHAHDGQPLNELSRQPITCGTEDDPRIAAAAAERVRELLHTSIVTATDTRPTLDTDVAVVTSHVTQAAQIANHLSDLPGVLIGTANSLQGAERAATVVIHPMTGAHEVTPFNTDLGRTCVALSRHQAHASILTTTHAEELLTTATTDAARIQRDVLAAIP